MTGKLTITCEAWRPLRKGSLLGFAKIRVVEMDMTFIDVAVHASHGKLWAAPPARPWVKDGAVVIGDSGKPQFSPIVEFGRKETRDAFSQRVVDAVLAFAPDAFGQAEGAA